MSLSVPQDDFGAQVEGDDARVHDSLRITRTSASEGHSCRQCGESVPGRRRNFCSDRCRMRARRADDHARLRHRDARLQDLVADVERAVAALKAELASGL